MQLLTPEYPLMVWSVILLLTVGLWVFALADVLRNDFRGRNEKLIWTIVVVLLPCIGTLFYFSIGRKHKLNEYS